MLQLTKDEESLLRRFFIEKDRSVAVYQDDNSISIKKSSDINRYTDKFIYDPIPEPIPKSEILKMREKGVGEFIRDPYYIQKQLKAAKRNDRFKNLPAMVLGIDAEGNHYFYEKGTGNRNKSVNLFSAIRLPNRSSVTTELGNTYHVYSPFRPISTEGIYDKNYSLKVLSWLLSDSKQVDELINIFSMFLKGVLVTHGIIPDIIITIKSSKPINSSITKRLESDSYFEKVKFMEIDKPNTRSVKNQYIQGDYSSSEFFDNLSSDEVIKMKELSPSDRKLYSLIVKDYFEQSNQIKEQKGKSIIFIDDVITTGSTLSNILIPLFEENNKLIPFTFLIR